MLTDNNNNLNLLHTDAVFSILYTFKPILHKRQRYFVGDNLYITSQKIERRLRAGICCSFTEEYRKP